MVATETVGPFDGTPWAQDQWYRYAPAWAPSGVIDTPAASASAGGLGVSFSGLTPTVAAGRAWARGAGYELSGGSKTLAAVAANTNASLARIDRLVLRRDLAAKTVTLVELQGTPASSPAPPALTQVETGAWDSPLFSFTVPANSGTTITGVTDERLWLSADTGQPLYAWKPLNMGGGWNPESGHTPRAKQTPDGRVRLRGHANPVSTYTPTGSEVIVQVPSSLPRPAVTHVFAVPYSTVSSGEGIVICTLHTDGTLTSDFVAVGPKPVPGLSGGTPQAAFFLDAIDYDPSYTG